MPRRCARAASLRPSTPIRGRRGYSDHVSEADPADSAASMRSPFLTPRGSKADSNSESHPRATPPAATRFIADSALEGAGFEPSVPRDTTEVSRGGLCRLARDSSPTGQRANGLGREPTFTTTPGAFRGTDVRIRFPPPANRMRTRFSWIRVGAGGLGSQRGCAGLQLDRAGAVRVARFVCSDSSAAAASGGASGSNAPTLSCSEDPAGCAATRLGSYGANGLLPTEYGRGPVTEERAPLFPR